MSIGMGLLVTALLLLLNAFFVAAEFALLSVRNTQLEPRAQAGSRSAKMALKAVGNLTLVLAAAQLGITACSVMLGAVSEPAIAYGLRPVLENIGLPENWLHPISYVVALTLVVYAHVVIGEMIPKNMSIARPENSALVLGPLILVVITIFKPIIVALNSIANWFVRLFNIEPRDELQTSFSHDEVAALLDESLREGLLDEDEYDLVSGALGLYTGTIADVLLPIDQLVTVGPSTTPADVEQLCAETGFSRFPVVDESGDLTGYVHIKDLLEPEGPNREQVVNEKWKHQLVSVRIDAGLLDALRAMQIKGAHIARVVSAGEVGVQAVGVVMLEDVLEQLVGEVDDTVL